VFDRDWAYGGRGAGLGAGGVRARFHWGWEIRSSRWAATGLWRLALRLDARVWPAEQPLEQALGRPCGDSPRPPPRICRALTSTCGTSASRCSMTLTTRSERPRLLWSRSPSVPVALPAGMESAPRGRAWPWRANRGRHVSSR